jgi:D-amino-acid dehydrogenase
LESRELYRQLESTIPSGFGMVENGLLMLCRTQRMLDEEAHFAGRAVALSMPAEVLGPAETAAIDPAVTMDVEGSVFYPRDCHLNPERLMQQLQRELLAGGATLEWNSQVNGFRVVRDHVAAVKTSKVEAGEKVTREIETDEVVICSGVWSTALGREFRLRLPMQAGKGYSVTLSDPPERPGICSILVEARVAVTPIGRHLRFGGTMELSGLSDAISSARVRGITHAATDYFPALKPEHFAGLSPWVGLRPCSPDGLPYVGRTRRYDNVLVSTGHAMMGISLAPVSAQHIARLVTQRRPPRDCDWSLLSPDRYG